MTPTPHVTPSIFWLAGLLILVSYAVGFVAEARDSKPPQTTIQNEVQNEVSANPAPSESLNQTALGLIDAVNRTVNFIGH